MTRELPARHFRSSNRRRAVITALVVAVALILGAVYIPRLVDVLLSGSRPTTSKAVPIDSAVGPQINAIIDANSEHQIGVALIDLSDGDDRSDGDVHEFGVRGKFIAASTAKILAAAAYYHLVESGEVSLTAPLGVSTADLQIQQMVQQSNNDSWALIVDAIGSQRIHDYAASIGIDYVWEENALSPAEMATILSLLYVGQLLDESHTSELLSYMQLTNCETLIPAASPQEIRVIHKCGVLYGNLHDASILEQGGRAYAFVVYTVGQDISDGPIDTAVIHELTRAVADGLF